MAIVVQIKNGQIDLKSDGLSASKIVSLSTSIKADINSADSSKIDIRIGGATVNTDTDKYLFYKIAYGDFEDADGNALGASATATQTALQAIFDSPQNLNHIIAEDTSAGQTGVTKLRYDKAASGGEDRDEGGTLELDKHSSSIGLYGSYLKITESDLNNTTGKNAAFGRLQFFLENQGTAYEVLDVLMGSLTSQPTWDVSSSSTTWSAPSGYTLTGLYSLKGNSSDVAEMRFYDTDSSHYIALKTPVINSNQTFLLPQVDGTNNQVLKTNGSGQMFFGSVDYTQVTNTPTIPTNVSDLTNDSGFITAANSLEGQVIDFFTSSTTLNSTGYEGEVIKIGNASSMSFGQLRYMSAAGSPLTARWANADASAASTSSGFLGFALGTSSTTDGMLTRGYVAHSNSYTPGAILYVSKTAGGITDDVSAYTTGNIVRIVGYAVNSGFIYFNPGTDFIELS